MTELESRVRALIEPQARHVSNRFMSALNDLRNLQHKEPEWELQKRACALAESFVEERLRLVVDALKLVVGARKLRVTEEEFARIFQQLRPATAELKRASWQNSSGSVISIHDYVIDQAYERVVQVSVAELALLSAPPPAPLHPHVIATRYVAPDTNVLIHFKHLSQVVSTDIDGPTPLKWLFLEQVIAELDAKAHHPEPYYHKRARSLQRLVSGAAMTGALQNGSSVTVFLPTTLPQLDVIDVSIADQRILAQAIAFQQITPGAAVTIATNDVALLLRARALGFEVLSFPDPLRRARTITKGAQLDD